MDKMRYLIGSGYHERGPESKVFHQLWLENTLRHCEPSHIAVVADSAAQVPRPPGGVPVGYSRINLSGNLGDHLMVLNGEKPHAFNGWSGAVLATAMLAYCDESDFIWKEQDCLWFGDCVGRMYEEIGAAGIIFGGPVKNGELEMPAAQSLFLVKHAFIPHFVSAFLTSGSQNSDDELGEKKFMKLLGLEPDAWKQFSFGYDRSRPFDVNAPHFYVQQLSAVELEQLHKAGLLG